MKQFDSSIVGQPYSRVMSFGVRYTATMTATVDVILQQHVKLLDGTPYGWLDLLSFLLPFRVSWSGSDFCSEVVSAALGLPKPWHTSPGDLWDWAVQQPGARVVPEDELRNAWRA